MHTAEDFIILQGHVYQHKFDNRTLQTREIKKFPLSSEHTISLHMHAKLSFAHRLQTAKIASSRTSAQNNGFWVQSVLLERKMIYKWSR